MSSELIDEIVAAVRSELKSLSTPRVPVPLKEAAEICHCEPRWLHDKVVNEEIRGYRPQAGSPWRVYVSDVIKYMTTECSVKPARRLRRVA